MIAMATAIITAIIEFAAGQLLYTRARSRCAVPKLWVAVHCSVVLQQEGSPLWQAEWQPCGPWCYHICHHICHTLSVQDLAVCVCRMTQSIQDMPPPEFGKAADDTAELESGDSSSISSGDTQVLRLA
jgi:hypothetical protein